MKFEISKRVNGPQDTKLLMNSLERQFKKISSKTVRGGSVLQVESIEATFGSINRKDTSNIIVRPVSDGCLLIAEVHYRPSIAFWILIIILLFTWIAWLLPIVFYLVQKGTVRRGIEAVFTRISDEHSQAMANGRRSSEMGSIDGLDKLASLYERGHLSKDEFEAKKATMLTDS